MNLDQTDTYSNNNYFSGPPKIKPNLSVPKYFAEVNIIHHRSSHNNEITIEKAQRNNEKFFVLLVKRHFRF